MLLHAYCDKSDAESRKSDIAVHIYKSDCSRIPPLCAWYPWSTKHKWRRWRAVFTRKSLLKKIPICEEKFCTPRFYLIAYVRGMLCFSFMNRRQVKCRCTFIFLLYTRENSVRVRLGSCYNSVNRVFKMVWVNEKFIIVTQLLKHIEA